MAALLPTAETGSASAQRNHSGLIWIVRHSPSLAALKECNSREGVVAQLPGNPDCRLLSLKLNLYLHFKLPFSSNRRLVPESILMSSNTCGTPGLAPAERRAPGMPKNSLFRLRPLFCIAQILHGNQAVERCFRHRLSARFP